MIEFVVLSSPACHLCEDATEALGELEREFPIRVREAGTGTIFTVSLPLASSGERAPFTAPSHLPASVGTERRR